jgi:formamidopyrimidine-DNA glycosylase
MPELPEVETIRLQLDKYLVGKTIEGVEVKLPKIFSGEIKNIVGQKITGTRRFAKVLVMDLSNGYSILTHLKMTGQYIYRDKNVSGELSKKVFGGVPGIHTHIIIRLSNGGTLYYNDVRRFGWLKVVQTSDVEEEKFVKKLGPEFLKNLNLEKFREILSKNKTAIKALLMDQEKVSGVGNIYANDALWLAEVSPKRSAKSLSGSEQKKLFESVEKVLQTSLAYQGSSEDAYVTPEGKEGSYQLHSLVYRKDGQICSRCKKAKIVRITQGGRGTFYCPICQK